MNNPRYKCEAEHEFALRYYNWALQDAEREVLEGFPLISRIKDKTPMAFLLVMETLPLEQQLLYSRIFVKDTFQHILNDPVVHLTDTESKLRKEFFIKMKKAGKVLFNQGALDTLEAGVKFKALKNLLEAQVPPEIGTQFISDGSRELAYKKYMHPWEINTHFDFGGRAKVHYVQIIKTIDRPYPRIKPLAVVDILIWQGIGQTGFNLMTNEDSPLVAKFLVDVCIHFMNIVPDLLADLPPTLIPE